MTPADSTTYTLTAKGAGGTQTATARVTVTAPPPPPPQPSATEEELFSQTVKDIYFDYDKSDINADQQSSMQGDIEFLKQHPNISFTVEGHCDERGSTEYNLALGDSRANSVVTRWYRAALAPTMSRPSATARKSRSAPNRTSSAGSRTGVVISSTEVSSCSAGVRRLSRGRLALARLEVPDVARGNRENADATSLLSSSGRDATHTLRIVGIGL